MSETLLFSWRKGLALAGLIFSLAMPAAAITMSTPTSEFLAVGRGVQVAPDWVLTVYHYAFNVGETFSDGYGSWTVAERYNAPGSGPEAANDLSLLRLVPNAGSAAVPYLTLNGVALAEGRFPPIAVTIASSANTSGPRSYAYTTVDQALTTADPDDAGPSGPVVVNWLVSEDAGVYVQSGDSGSGLFFGHVQDSSVLMGLSSAQFTDDAGAPSGSAFVQIAAYRGWIDATMAADGADGETLVWTPSAVPEPATAALAAAGLALLVLRRRARP